MATTEATTPSSPPETNQTVVIAVTASVCGVVVLALIIGLCAFWYRYTATRDEKRTTKYVRHLSGKPPLNWNLSGVDRDVFIPDEQRYYPNPTTSPNENYPTVHSSTVYQSHYGSHPPDLPTRNGEIPPVSRVVNGPPPRLPRTYVSHEPPTEETVHRFTDYSDNWEIMKNRETSPIYQNHNRTHPPDLPARNGEIPSVSRVVDNPHSKELTKYYGPGDEQPTEGIGQKVTKYKYTGVWEPIKKETEYLYYDRTEHRTDDHRQSEYHVTDSRQSEHHLKNSSKTHLENNHPHNHTEEKRHTEESGRRGEYVYPFKENRHPDGHLNDTRSAPDLDDRHPPEHYFNGRQHASKITKWNTATANWSERDILRYDFAIPRPYRW